MMGIGAVIGIVGIGLQFNYMMQIPGISTAEALVRFFSFFTILTNLLLVFGYVFPLIGPESAARKLFASASMRGCMLVYIVVVGAVYNLLPRQLYHPVGWAKVADVLVHDAAPVFYLIYWVLFAEKSGLGFRNASQWLLYPLAYLIYTLLRGAMVGYYPYPFVDVLALGYARVLVNAAGLTVVFWGLGLIVVAASRVMVSAPLRVTQSTD
ncbi:MAG TPA: Pr6Pr family membrane protein [Pseudacidobacterium sp.]|nr:Pr6Pr family membrane protein [Pseudacidobacterium sp.]